MIIGENINDLISNVREWEGAEEETGEKLYIAENIRGSTISILPSLYERTGWYDKNNNEYYRLKKEVKQ